MHELQSEIEEFYAMGPDAVGNPKAVAAFIKFREALTAGEVRAAEKTDGRWRVNAWVKRGILLGFRIGALAESGDPKVLAFVDKDASLHHFTAHEQVRVVPGGSSVRSGAYIAPSVVCMPPMFSNTALAPHLLARSRIAPGRSRDPCGRPSPHERPSCSPEIRAVRVEVLPGKRPVQLVGSEFLDGSGNA